jgi:ATP-dependent helicase/nuclease subunit B
VTSKLPIVSDELLALPAQQTLVLSPSDRARRAYEHVWTRATLKSQSKKAAALPRFTTTKLWFAQLWEEGQLFGLIDSTTTLISTVIERALWCHVVESIAQTTSAESNALADRMMEAWMLEQSYGDGASVPFAVGSSGDMYRAARSAFLALLKSRDAMTAAQLHARLVQHAEKLTSLMPQHVVQTPSFAPLPSEQRAIRALLSAKGAQLTILASVDGHHQRAKRTELSDPTEERDSAIEWAQHALASVSEEMQLPFAIVVPDLKQTRGAWQRRLSASGASFNLSLGLPVSAHPWAAAGFTLVGALAQPMPVETISQALRHPRWGHADGISSSLNRPVKKALSDGNSSSLLSFFLSNYSENARELRDRVDSLVYELSTQPARRSRTQWRAFFECAIAAFTSSERALSSDVFQLRQSLIESIETWQSLDEWLPATTMLDAQQELIAITDQAAFQPEGSDAPLQVIGLLESAGVPFQGMWITSMTEYTLPEASRSNPFLNARWQREARVGLANIDECDDRAARLVNGWSSLSEQVIASKAERVDGEPQVWSPLVSKWPRFEAPSEITQPAMPNRSAQLVASDDECAPAWRRIESQPQPLAHASVRAMESQALCPRRGLAAGRLKLDAWPEHFDGLSPLVRGNLVHAVAESLGRLRKSQTHDEHAQHDALPQFVNDAVNAARENYPQIAEHVWAAERDRLIRVWKSLLEKEALRTPFTVLHVEEKVQTQIGDLSFSLRMDRVDKFDAFDEATGEVRKDRLVVVDFKSGNADRNGLLDERLTAPQLPLYAHALGVSSVDAAIYARVSDDAQDFVGLGTRESGFAPKKNSTGTPEMPWETIRDGWGAKLATLANELIAGEAALAPAYGEATCDRCDFSRFCRVDFQALSQMDDEAAESGENES